MIDNYYLPKPKNEDVFENLITDLAKRQYATENFQRYGKKGQAQFGIDTVGIYNKKIIGIQSKNHSDPKAKISTSEIDSEIKKSEAFKPELDEYHIFTSADRDTAITSYVENVAKERLNEGKYPTYIKFWEDICQCLFDYPDLIYKYFSNLFQISEYENVKGFRINKDLETKIWPVSQDEVLALSKANLKKLPQADPYKISIGLSSFEDASFQGIADIDIFLSDDAENSEEKAESILKNLKQILNHKNLAKEVIFNLKTRLSFAFLVGSYFRKVSGYSLIIISGDQVWKTSELPIVTADIFEAPPKILNTSGETLAFVLNIARDINNEAYEFVKSSKPDCKYFTSYSVSGAKIRSAAHALAVAIDISKKIKSMSTDWGIKKIYFFGAIPVGLATLISYHLNATCPVEIYYVDRVENIYKCGAILK